MSDELLKFLRETQTQVRDSQSQSADNVSTGNVFAEMVFSEIVMQHMADVGMTFESVEVCHFKGKVGNAHFRLSGYALSDDTEQLDLFISLYDGVDTIVNIPEAETKVAVEQCLRFLELCAAGALISKLDPSSDVYSLVLTINGIYNQLDQIRIYVITDKVSKSKNYKTREIAGKIVKLEVMDIERLYRHTSEGKPRDELVIDFKAVSGSPLPCIYVPGQENEYDYVLTVIPGEALRFMYEKYGQRLLEANVRSFLSSKGKGVNAGIQATLRTSPEKFVAYNNGLVLVVDEVKTDHLQDGIPSIIWMKGMQIVNGGQTTASLYFSKRKYPEIDLSKVRVAAKIIILKENDNLKEEILIAEISKYANSQNSVKQSDLAANKPFHIEVERLADSVICPDGVGRWFYERASGSYNTLLARQGTTDAKLKRIKEEIPPSRKITKTDLAKFIVAWNGDADIVSLGSQKCFEKFMSTLSGDNNDSNIPDVVEFKLMISKAILFKVFQKSARQKFQAFQANIVAYTISMLATHYGDLINLHRIWDKQSLSNELIDQLLKWGMEVNSVLHETSGGKMISEWAKKTECKEAVLSRKYSTPADDIPEFFKN